MPVVPYFFSLKLLDNLNSPLAGPYFSPYPSPTRFPHFFEPAGFCKAGLQDGRQPNESWNRLPRARPRPRQLAHREANEIRGTYTHAAEFWPERVRIKCWWADELDRVREFGRIVKACTCRNIRPM
jgi:hypothetical protein